MNEAALFVQTCRDCCPVGRLVDDFRLYLRGGGFPAWPCAKNCPMIMWFRRGAGAGFPQSRNGTALCGAVSTNKDTPFDITQLVEGPGEIPSGFRLCGFRRARESVWLTQRSRSQGAYGARARP